MRQLHIYTPNTAKQINIKKKKKSSPWLLLDLREEETTEVYGDYSVVWASMALAWDSW